jgi:sulfite oxidase
MNGRPLRPEHGAPLRAVVPAYIGARSVKWLGRIELTRTPSNNIFQARTYKRVPQGATPADLEQARPMGDAPLNCAICAPGDGARISGPKVRLEGYAVAAGGRRVSKVEVSSDGGRSWARARLRGHPSPWAWRLWSASVSLPEGPFEIVARCFDSAGRGQPARLASAWNAGGYGNNAWHRIRVVVRR